MIDSRVMAAAVDRESPEAAWERLRSRWWSERSVHRFSHRQKIDAILPLLEPYDDVLDITRGASVDGVLGVMAAGRGKRVTIVSPSANHMAALRRFARALDIDPERVSWRDGCIDELDALDIPPHQCVTALHVLEHAPVLRAGLAALRRRTQQRCIVAVPTCANPTAWVRLGGATDPYRFGPGSLGAGLRGLGKVLARSRRGHVSVAEIVDEHGVSTVHRWFYPRLLLREIELNGFEVEAMRPDTLALPWSERLVTLSRRLQEGLPEAVTARWGFGTHYVLRPVPA